MLIPKVEAKEFEKFGFKKCKGEYGKNSTVSQACHEDDEGKSERSYGAVGRRTG